MKQLNTMRRLLTGVLAMVFVLGTAGIANAQGSENFVNSNATAAYLDGSFLGNGDITWTYGHSRNEDTFPIEGKGLMLRRASHSYLQAVIPGGVGNFSFQYRKAYSASAERQLELIINGTQVATTSGFGATSLAEDTVYTFNFEVNEPGDVTVRIKNVGSTSTNRQTVVDNFVWTGYVTAEPFVTPAPTTITELNYIHGSGPSNVQSFTLTGENLDESDVIVTAPSNFDVSTSAGSGFGSSVTLTAYNGSEQTIYVRLSESLTVAEYSGNISISGGGLTNPVTLPVSGEVRESIFLIYEFTGNSVVPTQKPTNSTTSNFQVSSGSITYGSAGVWSGSGTPYAESGSNWASTDLNSAKYYSFSIEPELGFGINLSNISFEYNATAAGPPAITVTINGIQVETFNTTGGTITSVSEALSDFANLPSVEVRIYGWNNGSRTSTGGGVLRINDVRLDGNMVENIYFTSLTGSEGYRLLSSPVPTTLQSLLKDNDIFTQCFTGATYNDTACELTNVGPNVFFFNATSGEYEAATNITNAVPAATGVLVYVFGKNNPEDESPSWPKAVSVSGVAHTLPVSPTLNASPEGFTLLGNPSASTISFDAFDIIDVNEVVYTWNANTGTDLDAAEYGSGSWISYSTSEAGDLTDGLLAPFQGFFVQTAEGTPSPTLSITSDAISGSATLYGKKSESLSARLTLSGEGLKNATWLSFNEAASIGRDRADALQLEPLSRNFAVISTQDIDGRVLDINNLPFIDEELELPLIVRATRNGEYTIALSSMNLPDNFSLHLRDNELGITQKIEEDFAYDFNYSDAVAMKSASTGNAVPQAMLAEETNSRFTLIVAPTVTLDAGNVLSELPERLALAQNYPNPFNPTTRISFELPSSQFVKLSVFNMLGQEVSTLVQSEMSAGSHTVNFDASQLSSGVYVYRLEAGGQVITRKMTLVK